MYFVVIVLNWTDQFVLALFLELHLTSVSSSLHSVSFSFRCDLLLFSSAMFSASAVPIFSTSSHGLLYVYLLAVFFHVAIGP